MKMSYTNRQLLLAEITIVKTLKTLTMTSLILGHLMYGVVDGVIVVLLCKRSNLLPDQTSALTHYAMQNEFLKAKEINDKLYNINKTSEIKLIKNPIFIPFTLYIISIL